MIISTITETVFILLTYYILRLIKLNYRQPLHRLELDLDLVREVPGDHEVTVVLDRNRGGKGGCRMGCSHFLDGENDPIVGGQQGVVEGHLRR